METTPASNSAAPAAPNRSRASRERLAEFRRQKMSPDKSPGDAAKGTPPRASKEERRRFIREYTRWLWPWRWTIAGLFLLALIAAAMDMVWPLAIKRVIDGVVGGESADAASKMAALNWIGGGIVVLLVVKELLNAWRSYSTTALNSKVIFRLRGRLFRRLLRLPLTELSEMKSGGIVSRLSGDVDSVSGLIQMAILSPGVAIIRVVLTVGLLLAISWQLAIAALIALPPLGLASYLWMRKVRPIYRSMREDRSTTDARVTETFGGIRVVRAFRREPREESSYAGDHHTVIRKSLLAERMELLMGSMWGLLIPGTTLLLTWLGGWLVLHGRASVGDIVAFQIYAVLLLQPMWQIVNSISQLQRSLAAMERIFSVMEMKPDKPDVDGAVAAPAKVDRIELDAVGFEYRAGTPVLSGISLDVRGGQTVALVGPSGSGKTTLTDLIARFHDPTSGTIRLNGIDLRNVKLASYRHLLAVVQQDVFLFDGTVAENIAYGRRSASAGEIEDAARRANAHEFIDALPQKYDTIIGERGFKLSGGQRQRLSIARAILADPQILILDEATSNLDSESEQLIQAALSDLFAGRTTFVIAHRLSTIAHADVIAVIVEGKLVETGTHEDLMAREGAYAAMVRRQREAFGEERHGSTALTAGEGTEAQRHEG